MYWFSNSKTLCALPQYPKRESQAMSKYSSQNLSYRSLPSKSENECRLIGAFVNTKHDGNRQ